MEIEKKLIVFVLFLTLASPITFAEIISSNQKRTCTGGRCTESIYGAPIFAKDSSGQWVNSSDVFIITRDSDDIIFHYDGIEGKFNITFESGAIYNGNYFSMATIKSNFPQLNFNFPSTKERTRYKYAVNITNINATSINPNLIESITLTYKTHSGFTLSQLRTETGSFTARNIMNLAFNDLLESGFTISTNLSERRIYIGNITANIVNGSLFLDPTVTIINETVNMSAYHADTNGDCDDPTRAGLYVGRPTKPYSDWTAFTAANYQALGASDDVRIATGSNAACKQFVFNYTLNSLVTATNLNWINFTWEGQMGTVSCNDDKIMFWNITNQTWSTAKAIAITTSDTTHNFNTSNITTFYNTTSREVLLGVTCNPGGAVTFRTDFASLEYNYNQPVPNLNSITLNQTVLRPNQNLNITANVTNSSFVSVHLDIINPSGIINVSNQSMTLQTPDIYYFGYTTNNTNGNWSIRVYANTTETTDSINSSSTSFIINATPRINSAELLITNLGNSSRNIQIRLNITDPDGLVDRDEIWAGNGGARNSTPLSTSDFVILDIGEGLTNATTIWVNDTLDNNASFTINFTITLGNITEQSGFSHNYTNQLIQLNSTIQINHSSMSYNVTYFTPENGTLSQGISISGTITGNSTASPFSNWTGDWITEIRDKGNASETSIIRNTVHNATLFLNVTSTYNFTNVLFNLSLYLQSWTNSTTTNVTASTNSSTTTQIQLNMTGTSISTTSVETVIVVDSQPNSVTYDCQISYTILNNDTNNREMHLRLNSSLCTSIGGSLTTHIDNVAISDSSRAYINTSLYSGFHTIVVTTSFGSSSLHTNSTTAKIRYTITTQQVGSAGGGGGGGGVVAQISPPLQNRTCPNFDVFIPGRFRPGNTTLPLDLQTNLEQGEVKTFKFGIENLGSADLTPIFQIIGSQFDQFGQPTIPITADQIKITKLWSILTPGQTENFDLVISAPQNGSGIYTGKVIIGCDPYADSISISAFVKAPGEEPSIIQRIVGEKLNLSGYEIPKILIIILTFVGTAFISYQQKREKFDLPIIATVLVAIFLLI